MVCVFKTFLTSSNEDKTERKKKGYFYSIISLEPMKDSMLFWCIHYKEVEKLDSSHTECQWKDASFIICFW